MKNSIFLPLISLFIPLLLGLSCEEAEPLPGQRVPLGDVSRDCWEPVEITLTSPQYLAAAGPILLIASSEELLETADGGNNWETVLTAQITSVTIDVNNPDRIVVTSPSRVYVSSDGGTSFKDYATPDVFVSTAVHPLLDEAIFAISDTSLWRSSDAGKTWQHVYTPPEDPKLTHLAADQLDTSYLYLIDGGGLRVSSTSGDSWEPKKFFESGDSISPFTHLKTTGQGLWAASDGVIRFSADKGSGTWLSYAPLIDLPDAELADFLTAGDNTILYAAFLGAEGNYQAYLTHDLGDHWGNASLGLVGDKGSLLLAADMDFFYALVVSEGQGFLYKFQDTELAP